MKYPKFPNKDSQIGVVALSAGVGNYINDYENSISNIKNHGFQINETKSVKNGGEVASDAKTRAFELNELFINNNVKLIMNATGGDFLLEILPYVNFQVIKDNPKWLMGTSDPTSLLYIITTSLDIATIYGFNACSFDLEELDLSQENALEIMRGKLPVQSSFEKYEITRPENAKKYNLTEPVFWENLTGEVDITGRIIGGCLDCLRYLPGTPFDYTKDFLERYKNDGIIWYFDIFSLTAEDFYLTLFQLKEASWFKYIKGVIVGRVKFPSNNTEMTYKEALKKIFINIPVILNADIGHIAPKMTIINGSIAHIVSSQGKGKIELSLR